MGVPVVSLVGENLYERISYTMLIQLGLKELCALTLDDYLKISVALAQDGDRLLRYRHSLRTRMRESALCQADRFADNFVDVLNEAVRRENAFTNVI
jgi:predicted O-linked N-acetylglucosamine transferase (SPINDLY family)